jgi:hypothetical protein
MDEKYDILALIAERKILEAIERGDLDSLPGAGKPLADDDLASLPDDLRLAWRILRGAGYAPIHPETGCPANFHDLFSQAPEGGQAYKQLARLKISFDKKNKLKPPDCRGQPNNYKPDSQDIIDSEYLDKVLLRLAKPPKK